MNSSYITRALSFHGQPMQKIWEDERGKGSLSNCGVSGELDYSIYQERQRFFTFQDRAKRLKLHQFFARKATDLYDGELKTNKVQVDKIVESVPYIAALPPYELFVNKNKFKQKTCRCVLEAIKPGDIIYCQVTKISLNVVKPLCTEEPMARYLADMPIKAYLTKSGLDSNGKPRVLTKNELVRCEVLEISIDAERLYVSLESENEKNKELLGVITHANLPKYYRSIEEHKSDKFEEYMFKSKEFLNPNYDILYEIVGLDVNETYSFMSSLKSNFPRDEYAKELRRSQASKWAFRSVAEGIEHFKNGAHVEAFQCLNKALTIDPRNVEGLVARGALYANKGSFLKAVDDFETALKLNAYHANARKYMGETLVALGRRYEDESRMKEAAKAYQDCLNIIPSHEQARLSLAAIKQRTNMPYFETAVAAVAAAAATAIATQPPIPGITMPLPIVPAMQIKQEIIEPEEEIIAVKESSSDEGSTTSGSSSESDHSDHEENGNERSLSPLSKRMALHVASLQKEEQSKRQLNQPFYMTAYNVPQPPVMNAKQNMTDFKLDDDDTGSRVRKLLQDASKHKKQKKKSKKKKSKKTRKVGRKEKNATTLLEGINFQEAYKAISSMNIENKLTQNLQKYEATIAQIKKRQNELVQSIEAGMTERKRSDSPPPRAPSMRLPNTNIKPTTNIYGPSTSSTISNIYSKYPSTSLAASAVTANAAAAAAAAKASAESNDANKLKFQIKRATKVDLMGLVRIATPLAQTSRSRTRSPERRRRSRSRSRTRSRSPGGRWNRRRYRSRSTSITRGRRRRSRSRRSSRSRSPYRRSRSPYRRSRSRSPYRRSRSRSRPGRSRRVTPPRRGAAVRRGRDRRPSPPPRRRSPSPRTRATRGGGRGSFGNRVWRREEPEPGCNVNGRWLHDKFENEAATGMPKAKPDDGPSIEEIDEIINRAQQQRKLDIIQRNKDILKRPMGGPF